VTSRVRVCTAIVAVALVLGRGDRLRADESDNFTCAARVTRDSLFALDSLMNARIRDAIERINSKLGRHKDCDEACRIEALVDAIGQSSPSMPAGIPHSKFAKAIDDVPGVDRCHLKFGETIYGARRYNQPWLFPFNGRIIFVADSIRLSGHLVGLDKVDHFIREGLDHWRRIRKGGDIASEIQREVGDPHGQFGWTEYGVKGMSLTGVFAYADLAAGYNGYRFWKDVLSFGRPESFVSVDASSGKVAQQRSFSFAPYVNDAWDESINRSVFNSKLDKEVSEALRQRSLGSPARDCRNLAGLPDARLYVNPNCFGTY
jgi:hypothetical protein